MFGKGYRGIFSKMGEGLLEKYIQDLTEELKRSPQDPELLLKLGIAYVRVGKIDSAREVYKRLKEIDAERAKELLDLIYEV
ncbi:MAG TPA: tetratricopeptide repeat protein [Aquificaceae bacterium]|nr:tetratricopeptide repeat protein [Aquificaceae bacterium]